MKQASDIKHKILMVRAEIDRKVFDTLSEKKDLTKWMKDTVAALGMKIVIAPRHFYVTDEHNAGWTGSLNLSTSHFAYHHWNNPDAEIMQNKEAALLQFDIYTCGCLGESEVASVLRLVDETFGIVYVNYLLLDRAQNYFEVLDEKEEWYITGHTSPYNTLNKKYYDENLKEHFEN